MSLLRNIPPIHRLSQIGTGLMVGAMLWAAGVSLQEHQGFPLTRTLAIAPEALGEPEGLGHHMRLPSKLTGTHRRTEHRGVVLENGRPIGPVAESAGEVKRVGSGLHIINDNGVLWFSTTDGSDPSTNGRGYTVRLPRNPSDRHLPGAAVLAAVGGLLWLSPLVRRIPPAGWMATRDWLGRLLSGGRWLRALGWAVLFLASWWHYSRHNDFAYHYHPDEPKKAFFVTHKRAHFNHPQLLTTTSRMVHWLGGGEATPQEATEIGRHVSAAFAAAAVVLLAWTGVHLAGLAALAIVPLAWYLPGLHEAAHYMKEDTALIFGLAAAIAGAAMHSRRPGLATSLLAGAGAGLAASGKYVGLPAVPLVLLSVGLAAWSTNGPVGAGRSILRAALSGMVVFLIIQFDAFRQWQLWLADFGREVDTFGPDRRDHAIAVPNAWFAGHLAATTPMLLWPAVLAGLAGLLRRRGPGPAGWLVPLGYGLFYMVILAFSIYPYPRYALPVEVLLIWLAACGLGHSLRVAAPRLSSPRGKWLAAATGLAWLVAIALPWSTAARDFEAHLRNDTRRDLYVFIRDQLPGDSVIAQPREMRLPFRDTNLPAHLETLPHTVVTRATLNDFGNRSELAAHGVTHLAVFLSELPENWFDADMDGCRETRLANLGGVIWRSTGPYGGMVAREIALIELPR